jgi:hypothetical protein
MEPGRWLKGWNGTIDQRAPPCLCIHMTPAGRFCLSISICAIRSSMAPANSNLPRGCASRALMPVSHPPLSASDKVLRHGPLKSQSALRTRQGSSRHSRSTCASYQASNSSCVHRSTRSWAGEQRRDSQGDDRSGCIGEESPPVTRRAGSIGAVALGRTRTDAHLFSESSEPGPTSFQLFRTSGPNLAPGCAGSRSRPQQNAFVHGQQRRTRAHDPDGGVQVHHPVGSRDTVMVDGAIVANGAQQPSLELEPGFASSAGWWIRAATGLLARQ